MKTSFTLGRSPENDLIIDDPTVGRRHLTINFISESELQIEDLDSNNYTFVNNQRVKRKTIAPTDEIKLGSYILPAGFLFSETLKKVNESKTDFSEEFVRLKKIYGDYERKLNELKRKSQVAPMLIRTVFTLVVMASAFFLIKDPQVRYPIMTGAGLIGGLITLNVQRDMKLKDQIDILTAELEMVYKCPKCGKSLISRRWQHWASKKECENCGAKWVT